MTPAVAHRLSDRGIEVLGETKGFTLLGRGNCVALVERTAAGFGSIGGTGIMTAAGLAYLVWREGRACLAVKGGETAAAPEDVEAIRAFSEDLKFALG